jgi:hypothetical protein
MKIRDGRDRVDGEEEKMGEEVVESPGRQMAIKT